MADNDLITEGQIKPLLDHLRTDIPADVDAAVTAAVAGLELGGIDTIVAGTGISINIDNPRNPVITNTGGGGGGGAVDSVNDETGVVILDAADVGAVPLSRSVTFPVSSPYELSGVDAGSIIAPNLSTVGGDVIHVPTGALEVGQSVEIYSVSATGVRFTTDGGVTIMGVPGEPMTVPLAFAGVLTCLFADTYSFVLGSHGALYSTIATDTVLNTGLYVSGLVMAQTGSEELTITIPPAADISLEEWPQGASATFVQYGTNPLTFAPGSGVFIRAASGISATTQYSVCTLTRLLGDEWLLKIDGPTDVIAHTHAIEDLTSDDLTEVGGQVWGNDGTTMGWTPLPPTPSSIVFQTYTDVDAAREDADVVIWLPSPDSLGNPTNYNALSDHVFRSNSEEDHTYALSDETTALTTGVKLTFRSPYAYTVSKIRASLTTASSSGAVTIDITVGGVSMLSTPLTIDQGETTSVTAAVAAVISDATIADDAEVKFNVTGAGTGAAGLKVTIYGARD